MRLIAPATFVEEGSLDRAPGRTYSCKQMSNVVWYAVLT